MNHPLNRQSDKGSGRLGDNYPDATVTSADATDSVLKMNSTIAAPTPTHLECAIAKLIGAPRAAVVSKFFASVLSVSSMICVPAIFGASLVMATQRPPIENIALKQNSIPTIEVEAGYPIQVTSPIILNAQVMRARFLAILRDENGNTVYVWPVLESDNPMTLMGGSTYRIPSTLPTGVYTLHVQVIYKVNPLVSGQVRTDIARVVVVN